MYKLLRAECKRLFQSWYFWGVFALVSLMNLYMGLVNRKQMIELFQGQMPSANLFGHTVFLGIGIAILVGLFVGDEYSDKTLRNKFMVGSRRGAVYFCYYVVVLSAAVMCHIFAMLIGYLFGRMFIGTLTISFSLLFRHTVYSLFPIAAMCAVSLCCVTIVQSKAIGCGIANGIATCCTFAGSGILGMIHSKEWKDSVGLDFLPETYLGKIRSFEDLVVNECLTEISFPMGSLCVCLLFLLIGVLFFYYMDVK